jgi:hypothetical protein
MSKKQFDTCIDLEGVDRLTLSEHDHGLWLSVWKLGAHAAVAVNRDKVIELRNGLNQFLAMNEVANTAESA